MGRRNANKPKPETYRTIATRRAGCAGRLASQREPIVAFHRTNNTAEYIAFHYKFTEVLNLAEFVPLAERAGIVAPGPIQITHLSKEQNRRIGERHLQHRVPAAPHELLEYRFTQLLKKENSLIKRNHKFE